MLNGCVNATHKALTHHRAHAAPHEVEFKAGRHSAYAQHGTPHDHQGVSFARVFQRFFQTFGVFAAVLELERIHGQHFLANLKAAFIVQKGVEPRPCAHAVVVAAGGADILVLLQVGLVQHGFATGAFDPQPFGHTAPVGRVGVQNFWGE